MATYVNTCTYCGKQFDVDHYGKHNPSNKRKFKRACSTECTRRLMSMNAARLHLEGKLVSPGGRVRELDREDLIRLYCYEHKMIAEIAKELRAKPYTVTREMRRLGIPKIFYRNCPQCGETYECRNRSMVQETSNKFKKYCSRKCFLSSRNNCDTWIEREVDRFLIETGTSFDKQVPIGRMTADFVVYSNIVIEVNGDFWHANPDIYGKSKPLHKTHARVIEKDKRKLRQLEELGYRVVTVWENDLKTDLKGTLGEMQRQIESLTKGAA